MHPILRERASALTRALASLLGATRDFFIQAGRNLRTPALALGLIAAPGRSNAAPSPQEADSAQGGGIEWIAPAGCGDPESLRAHAEELLTEPAPDSAWREVRIAVSVEESAAGYRVNMQLESSYGRSELKFEAQRCDEILAVVLQLKEEGVVTLSLGGGNDMM